MPIYVNTFFEDRLRELMDLAKRVSDALSSEDIDYRALGGLAVYLYVEEAAIDAGRLTKDIDIAVRCADLDRIIRCAARFGLRHSVIAGVDGLARSADPRRRAIRIYPSSTPELGPSRTLQGIRLLPLADLVRMKLTSVRAKDETHIVDLDEAGLITPEIEAVLSPELRARLQQARSR